MCSSVPHPIEAHRLLQECFGRFRSPVLAFLTPLKGRRLSHLRGGDFICQEPCQQAQRPHPIALHLLCQTVKPCAAISLAHDLTASFASTRMYIDQPTVVAVSDAIMMTNLEPSSTLRIA